MATPGAPPPAHAEVRMVARPASVPAVRRFVRQALTGWGCEDLVDDVGLCASELVTNATLHSGTTFFQVDLDRDADGVRLTVADAGGDAVDVLARQPDLNDARLAGLSPHDAAATGRGVFLVAALAVAWGIDELAQGKRVWAHFRAGTTTEPVRIVAPEVTRSPDRPVPALDPSDWAVVRFLDCPPGLLIAHDDNIADYTRELYLVGDRLGEPAFARLASVLDGYVAQHAANWDPARWAAHEALRAGHATVDLQVLATRDIRASIDFLRSLVGEAERLSREGVLMTLPAPEPVQRLRDWLEQEFVEQIEDDRAPVPYSRWRARAGE